MPTPTMGAVDVLARAVPTDPATYQPDLSVELLAALRQAWEQDVPFVNVVGLLGATGYELRIVPCPDPTLAEDEQHQWEALTGLDGEPQAGTVEALVAELADRLGVSKGLSFEVENRIIARNRKRKAALEPHPFKQARWATRDGRVRCQLCGSAQPDGDSCPGLGVGKAAPTKRDNGEDFPAAAYAYTPDPEKPSTWKLRLWANLDQKETAAQVGAAVAALGPGGFRGNRVEIPDADLPGVKRRVLAAWRKVHGDGQEPPAVLKAADTYTPPKGVQEAAQRALGWISEGKAGDGFTATGRARAAQLARGDAVSADTVTRMSSYFARHEVDRQATGFNAGEKGYPSPGRVAWDAWGGDAGRSWAQRIADTLTKENPTASDVHVDTVMPSRRSRRKPAAFISGEPRQLPADSTGASMAKADTYEPQLSDRQAAMYEANELIAETFGPWEQGSGSEGAHYMPASANPFAAQGLACHNCVFYEGGGGCEIVGGQVDPEGLCKLWVIEETLLQETAKARASLPAGAAAVAKADGALRYTMGPMYVPDALDAHGEWTDADQLQAAVWEYVRGGDRGIRLQHNRDVVAGEWVECMAWPFQVTVPMQTPDGTTSVTYPPNTVFLGVVWEPWAWSLVTEGKLRGFSIGGKAERIMADFPATTTGDTQA